MSVLRRQVWRHPRGYECRGGTVRVRGVEWTTNSYWMARTRVVGGLPDWKKYEPFTPSAKDADRVLSTMFADGYRGQRVGNARLTTAWDNIEVVIVGEHRQREHPPSLAQCSRVTVIVDRLWFDPLDELLRRTGPAELRVNPWTGAVTWWTTTGRPYMLGGLLGLRPQPFEWVDQ